MDSCVLLKIWVETEAVNIVINLLIILKMHFQLPQKDQTAEATGDLIGNKIADKITRVSKTSPQNNLEINKEILNFFGKFNWEKKYPETKTNNYGWYKIKERLM